MPLFHTHPVEDFPIGNCPISAHQARLAAPELRFHPKAWLSASDVHALSPDGPRSLVDQKLTPLAWFGDYPDPASSIAATSSFIIVYPWDLLRANELHLEQLQEYKLEGNVHPLAHIDGYVHIGPGTRILPGVVIEGNVVIGAECKIGPNCYLRGHTSIGDHCHVGQSVEVKNSIILSHSHIGHLSYLGDSILGEHVNFGAGTITSNFRHDGKNHRSMIGTTLIDTGRSKLGSIIGDGVHTGINTSIYPGRKLFPGTSTRPGEIVRHDLHPS